MTQSKSEERQNILTHESFQHGKGQSSGGKTGSMKVRGVGRNRNKSFQLKNSIEKASVIRQRKSSTRLYLGNISDHENMGEVIASTIARSMFGPECAPKVYIVYPDKNGNVSVASEYFTGDKVRDLDDFVREQSVKIDNHAIFVEGKKISSNSIYLTDNLSQEMKKSLAEAVVLSTLFGDHDVNPGNMIVIKKNGIDKTFRIDFGHSFNDLINHPEQTGGQLKDPQNSIKDFFNRRNVAKFPTGSESKLWRSYPGFVFSKDMLNALKSIKNNNGLKGKIEKGVEESKEEFMLLLEKLDENDNKKGKELLMRSLEKIYVATNLRNGNQKNKNPFKNKKLKDRKRVNAVFKQIEEFVTTNCDEIKEVADLMELQIKIDKCILEENRLLKNQLYKDIQKDYRKLRNTHKLKDSLTWIRTNPKKDGRPFKGDLKGYINYRYKELHVNYKLDLISNLRLKSKEFAEYGKIYLAENGNYVVRDPNGKVQTGNLGFKINLKSGLNDKTLKEKILNITSKRGHTRHKNIPELTIGKQLQQSIEKNKNNNNKHILNSMRETLNLHVNGSVEIQVNEARNSLNKIRSNNDNLFRTDEEMMKLYENCMKELNSAEKRIKRFELACNVFNHNVNNKIKEYGNKSRKQIKKKILENMRGIIRTFQYQQNLTGKIKLTPIIALQQLKELRKKYPAVFKKKKLLNVETFEINHVLELYEKCHDIIATIANNKLCFGPLTQERLPQKLNQVSMVEEKEEEKNMDMDIDSTNRKPNSYHTIMRQFPEHQKNNNLLKKDKQNNKNQRPTLKNVETQKDKLITENKDKSIVKNKSEKSNENKIVLDIKISKF